MAGALLKRVSLTPRRYKPTQAWHATAGHKRKSAMRRRKGLQANQRRCWKFNGGTVSVSGI